MVVKSIESMEQYQERENLRNQIRTFWQDGRTWTPVEHEVMAKLNAVHTEIIKKELLDETKPKVRIVFSVCGYDQRHGFFRTKRFKSATLDEAKAELQLAKKEPDWNIPTIIVKETFYRKNSPAMVDFDGDIYNLGFSDTQEIIEKSMCGNHKFRWKDLIGAVDRFTY
jgi:hypothetical protein